MMSKKKILILGSTGMLGSCLVNYFSLSNTYEVFSADRALTLTRDSRFPRVLDNCYVGIDFLSDKEICTLLENVKPDIVLNCIGRIKQLNVENDPIQTILINSLLPHRLAKLTSRYGFRLIHFSTDCVFSGEKGDYCESDTPDPNDFYGLSKLVGEVEGGLALTLRTSIIGHELQNKRGLIEWFLSQDKSVSGYKSAIFSGLPTVEVARVLEKYIFGDEEIRGLYHLASSPISKYELLKILARTYNKDINIKADNSIAIDRSLNSNKFQLQTGYIPKEWNELIVDMYNFSKKNDSTI